MSFPEASIQTLRVLSEAPAGLITDIDGTISAIAPTPGEAFVSESVRGSLRRLAGSLTLVAVVTAREEGVARAMVGVPELTYVGNYALKRDDLAPTPGQLLAPAKEAVRLQLGPLPCVQLEDKGIAFALHYRGCDDRVATRAALLTLVEPIANQAGARVIEGKQVIELVPRSLPDKGDAVGRLIDQNELRGVVYLGDDLGDVAVFQELRRRRQETGLSALGIAVTDHETEEAVLEAADMRVQGAGQVEELLACLARSLEERGEA